MYGCINFIIDSTTTSTSIYTWHIADSFTTQHIQTRAGNTSSNMSDKTSPAGSTGGGLGVAVQGGKSKNKASPSRARSGSRGHSQSPSPRSRSHSKSRQVKLSTKFRKISQYSEGASYSPCWNESFYGHFHTFLDAIASLQFSTLVRPSVTLTLLTWDCKTVRLWDCKIVRL